MTRLPFFLIAVAALGAGIPAMPVLAEAAETAASAAETPQVDLPAITVSTVENRTLRDRIVGSGLVTPVERVLVQPLIEGQPIESLEAEVGDQVKKGEVLARLSKSTLVLQQSQFAAQRASAVAAIAQAEAQMAEAKANSDEAQRVSKRTQQLRAQGSSSQAAAESADAAATAAAAGVTMATQGLEAAKAQLELVDAQIEDLKLQLSRTEVVAPVAGEVVARNAMVGAIATAASDPMFTLIRDNELELRAEVAERFMLKLKAGQKVTMRGVGPGQDLTGTVRLVQPDIDLATRLGLARISIDNPQLVRSGMFFEADILVAEHDAASVPVTAIGATADETTVMKVTDGKVSRVPVTLGIRDGDYVEVLTGVEKGDLVVTKAAAFVRDGDRINPVPDTAGTN
ncbi:MAG: efflux RND transporter periplasmic adaptor subunit [Cereibacter sphaeroides]|uniref:Efflux RND transporter periplasmic adaptor subunit n=1 Tax=Cereibacter sphaeroides TaxID=1063 RepID=A0A2W5S106_CERSP|nr:MAG: efflux RND transporter periplasmic adaptor subunit [Cereibacter sphaeroides]